jgi:hypothetical protein
LRGGEASAPVNMTTNQTRGHDSATRGGSAGQRRNKRGREAKVLVNATRQPTKLYGPDKKQRHDERENKAKAPGNAKQCEAT